MGKALDATEAPAWFTLECSDELRIKVKALSEVERQALIASVPRASMLGFALMDERQKVGADAPTVQARHAAQVEWAKGLSERKRKALLDAEGYQLRALRAWVAECVVAVEIDGEPYDGGLLPLIDAIRDPGLLAAVMLEAGALCVEFSSLGKAGPMCSARLCGAPTPGPVAGPASDAPPPSADGEATAAAPSLTMPAGSCEAPTGNPSATSAGG